MLQNEAGQSEWNAWQGRDKSVHMLGIINDTLDNVGTCGLTSIDMEARRAEFSLFIAPEFQGKGLGKTAMRDLLEYGYLTMNLRLIYGETFVYPQDARIFLEKNEQKFIETEEGLVNPAWAMFQDFGFVREGLLRRYYVKFGYYVDAIRFSMEKDRWKYCLQHALVGSSQAQ